MGFSTQEAVKQARTKAHHKSLSNCSLLGKIPPHPDPSTDKHAFGVIAKASLCKLKT